MIPQGMVMCRESRKILNELSGIASKYNRTTIVKPSEIMMADFVCLKYYTNPVINIIKSKIKSMKSCTSKHFNIEYWVDIVNRILYNKNGVCREYNIGIPGDITSFECICRYLVVDYSINDAYDIYMVITTHTLQSIQNAIRIAKQNNVYNIQYIKTILDKEKAVSDIRRTELQELINKENKSNSILDRVKVVNSQEDMKEVSNNWEQIQENAKLSSMFDDIYGGNK